MATIGELLASEFSRIEGNRDTIRNKLVNFGEVESSATLAACATAIDGMVNNGAINAEVKEGETYTIPKGWHNGSGSVAGVSGGGNYSLQTKNVTPTKSQQNITSDDGYYGLSSVNVAAIPEAYQDVSAVTATAATILSPYVAVDKTGAKITGSIPSNGDVSASIDGFTVFEVTIPAGYTTGGKVSMTDDILNRLKAI